VYIPAHFTAGPDSVQQLLSRPAAANLITSTPNGILATLMPFVFDPTSGERGALHGHLARNNPQWSEPAAGESLAIIQGADAYISPSWYATKAEHGRVVPTWNYSTAHVYGNLVIHDDPAWLARRHGLGPATNATVAAMAAGLAEFAKVATSIVAAQHQQLLLKGTTK